MLCSVSAQRYASVMRLILIATIFVSLSGPTMASPASCPSIVQVLGEPHKHSIEAAESTVACLADLSLDSPTIQRDLLRCKRAADYALERAQRAQGTYEKVVTACNMKNPLSRR